MILSSLGTYPTPVERLRQLERGGVSLWVKRDDRTHPDYGGNKVRKLEYILPEALRQGARRIVTVGAVGSHHVLATTLFGTRAGFEVDAVLVPQPRTAHVVANLRADLALGLRAHAAVGTWSAPLLVASLLASASASAGGGDAFYVPVGGSSALGALGYVDAGIELALQIRQGMLPKPDVVVVTVGSGGTAAGLVVGFAKAGLDIPVLGVCVAAPVWMVRIMVDWLVRRTAERAAAHDESPGRLGERARSMLTLTTEFLGGGYGVATDVGDSAILAGAEVGLDLDPTYTAKAFAATLAEVERRSGGNVLYWHTLSSASLDPLLAGTSDADFPPRLAKLLR